MEKILGCKEPYKGDPEKRFEFVKSFGSGGFGTVELCRDIENNNKLVIKKLAKIEGTTMNEIAMLYHIRHKYIIKLYEYYQTKIDQATIDRNEIKGTKANTPMYGMIIEFGEGGDLLKYISERLSIEEIILLKIIDQSAQALQFLNDNRTMHRDIKPENILLDKYGDIKLADFGTGDVLPEDSTYRTFTQQTGTQIYMAPEIKAQHKYYTYAIDVYSLGVSIYRACRGNLQNNDLKAIDVDGLPEPIPEQYSLEFVSLIKKMLAFDENDRATLSNIRETIQNITTPITLSETDQNLLKNSLNLFYGTDGITNKEEAIQNFQKLVNDTKYECPESAFQLAQCYLYGDTVQQDKEQAIKLLRMSARKNHSQALITLAFCYEYGIGVEKDLFTTVQLLTIAKRKEPEASFLLGSLFCNGEEIDLRTQKLDSKNFVKQDFELAFHYFSESKNFVPSQNCLGICYMKGKGVESNPYESYKYLSSAANEGFLDAKYNLALFYLEERGNDQKYIEKALKLLTETANQYHLGAAFKLGELYENGNFVEKDDKKAAFYKRMNSTGPNVYDALYSFALFKMNGFKGETNLDMVEKNQYQAFSLFSICSEKHAGAKYRLAQMYRDGIGTNKDTEKAITLLEESFNDGIIDAKVDIAKILLNDQKDIEKVINILNETIELGSLYGNRTLSECYMKGEGVEVDKEKALKLLREANFVDDLERNYLMAKIIREKGLEEMDFDQLEESMKLFEKSANKGHSNSSYEMGKILSQGIEIYIDKEKAFKFFQIASEQNHPEATTELGQFYEKRNERTKSFEMYRKSSNLGDKEGIYHLSMCYLKGNGVEVDNEKGLNLLEKASELGVVEAKLQLGLLYKEGKVCDKDEEKSAKLFEEASKHGNNEAKVELGKCYLKGKGVAKDPKMSFKLFKEASNNKNVKGKYRLAKLYLKGEGVRQNPQEAILLFEYLVREKKYTPAMYELGKCYLEGIGCDADAKKGVQTLKKAVKNGNCKAMNLLGLCYLNGNGARTNYDAAIEYFQKGSEGGNKEATENLKKYKKEEEKVTPKTNEQLPFDERRDKVKNNIPLIKVSSASTVHLLNESHPIACEHSSQRIPESSRLIRTPSKDNRNPRTNQRLYPAVNRQQKDRIQSQGQNQGQNFERTDVPLKLTRRVMFGPMPPLLQKSRSGRRTFNQTVQGQYRL